MIMMVGKIWGKLIIATCIHFLCINTTCTAQQTNAPTSPPPTSSPTQDRLVRDYIQSKKTLIETRILVSYDRSFGQAYSSKQYTYNQLMKSLQTMAIDGFGADFQFNVWEGDGDRYIQGLINLSAFLANAMVESIEDDTCDELNWQQMGGDQKYPLSNSCGQEGRNYDDENCSLGTNEFLSCDVNKSMQVTAVNSGTQVNAPPPFTCQQGTSEGNFAGYWDATAGRAVTNAEFANAFGRTDTQGCCWWGRGALMTRGVCNIGKMNYYLGKRGAELGRSTLYPTIDFCRFPESTCASVYTEDLRWNSAFFEWAEKVQRYEADGWNFDERLASFVDSGMTSDYFINGVSRILSQGCHASGCSEVGEARMLNKRQGYFFMIINDVFELKSLTQRPSPLHTKPPTPPAVVDMPILSQRTPSPVSQDDLRPSLTANSSPQPVPISNDKTTNIPTNYSTLIVLEGNAASYKACTKQLKLLQSGLLLVVLFALLT